MLMADPNTFEASVSASTLSVDFQLARVMCAMAALANTNSTSARRAAGISCPRASRFVMVCPPLSAPG